MPGIANTYKRSEKLKSRKAMEHLFAKGKYFTIFPIKVFYTTQNISTPILTQQADLHAGVGVSSRIFKKAVQRNKIKRLLREVYRTEKQALQSTVQSANQPLSVFFLYIGKEMPLFTDLQHAMKKSLERLESKVKIQP